MDPLWLLKGHHDAPGWTNLERDSKAGTVDLVIFDRDHWALVRAAEPPTAYEGLVPTVPRDGVYLDHTGRPFYLLERKGTDGGARAIIDALGPEAKELLEKLGDPDLVLERLGRFF